MSASVRLIGNTAEEVARYLTDVAPPGARTPPVDRQSRGYWWRIATTDAERRTLGRYCPACDALDELCLSATGLPASGPHDARRN